MQNGLVAYGDDSDSGDEADSKTGTKLKAKADSTAELRIPRKPQIVIKKPKTSQRPKGHVNIEATQSGSSSTPVTSTSESSTFTPLEETLADPEPDDVQRIRTLLRPPPVPGLDDWGIPPEVPTEESVTDPALESKLKQFHELKSLPNPKHFNDTLMSNRSFRNPHLYAQLVEFVDIDERTTNFPKSVWDPDLVRYSEWDADRIAAYQKTRSEQQSQQSKARTQIDFTSSSKDNKPHPYGQSNPRVSGNLSGASRRQGRGSTRWV